MTKNYYIKKTILLKNRKENLNTTEEDIEKRDPLGLQRKYDQNKKERKEYVQFTISEKQAENWNKIKHGVIEYEAKAYFFVMDKIKEYENHEFYKEDVEDWKYYIQIENYSITKDWIEERKIMEIYWVTVYDPELDNNKIYDRRDEMYLVKEEREKTEYKLFKLHNKKGINKIKTPQEIKLKNKIKELDKKIEKMTLSFFKCKRDNNNALAEETEKYIEEE